jgi:hypothetical protein
MAHYLYIRGLRQVDHTVFAVANGQKSYRSPITGQPQPYSSGQQVKRSILDTMVAEMEGEMRAPITFNYQVSSKKGKDTIEQKEPWNPCDPSYADQLIGGWMRAKSGEGTIKRRSPLSISAMRPLHPSLANLEGDESGTFDRSDDPDRHIVKVRNAKGEELSQEEIRELLQKNDRNLPLRNWLNLGPRANGLFIYDIAVDLERLFTVSTNQYDPELTPETIEKLIANGWEENGSVLVAPKEKQEKIISALATALVDWRITSNQSRTFSPQGTLAIAISENANSIINAIRADLRDDQPEGRLNADPVIDTTIKDAELFIAPATKGFIADITVTGNAMNEAKIAIGERLLKAMSNA